MLANVDALGHRTSSVYDATGRGMAQQDARGYLTSFVFDAAGRQLAVVDASGHRTSNLYDARGMVQATQDPLGTCTTYAFDGAGNTVLRVDARSWPTTYTVDALNRVTGQLYLDGTRVTFTFDGDGRQATMQDVTGVTTLQYDAAGWETLISSPVAVYTTSCDGLGNRLTKMDAGGITTHTPQAEVAALLRGGWSMARKDEKGAAEQPGEHPIEDISDENLFVARYEARDVPKSLARQCYVVLAELQRYSRVKSLTPETPVLDLCKRGWFRLDPEDMLDDILEGLGLTQDHLENVELLRDPCTVDGLVLALKECLRGRHLP